jgi:hypothetical protein
MIGNQKWILPAVVVGWIAVFGAIYLAGKDNSTGPLKQFLAGQL